MVPVGGVGTTAAAATDLAELTGAAPPTEARLTQIVKHAGPFPQPGKRGLAQIPSGHGHVGAGCRVAFGGDTAMIFAGRTRTVRIIFERGEAGSSCQIIRRKWGAPFARMSRPPAVPMGVLHGSSYLVKADAGLVSSLPTLCARASAVKICWYCWGDVSELLATSCPYQKKKFSTCAEIIGQINHRRGFCHIPVRHRHL